MAIYPWTTSHAKWWFSSSYVKLPEGTSFGTNRQLQSKLPVSQFLSVDRQLLLARIISSGATERQLPLPHSSCQGQFEGHAACNLKHDSALTLTFQTQWHGMAVKLWNIGLQRCYPQYFFNFLLAQVVLRLGVSKLLSIKTWHQLEILKWLMT